MKNLKIVFDSEGGAIADFNGYVRYYDDMDRLADDYLEYENSGSTEGWAGSEAEKYGFPEYDMQQARLNGAVWYDAKEIEKLLEEGKEAEPLRQNVKSFIAAINKIED